MTLEETINKKLMEMFARKLDYTPANAEALYACAKVMIKDFINLGFRDHDAERIAYAFDYIGPRIHKWPTMMVIKENIPKRSHYHITDNALPATKEQALRHIENIKKIVANAKGPLAKQMNQFLTRET